jgi:glycosyltransferase involved in cell wall biosynthesis
MPDTRVTALGSVNQYGAEHWQPMRYRRPVRRFVEAGAFAWMRGLDRVAPDFDWVASLELCSLVSGQAATYAEQHGLRYAVVTWENDPRQPLYRIPPYRQAVRRTREADLFLCMISAARDHLLTMGYPDDRIKVILPGVDTEIFHPATAPLTDPVIVFVSPLAANKGIDRVLEAFDIVRGHVPETRLRVLGRGPLESLVRSAVERTDGAVELVGAGDATLVADTLRSGVVFVTAPRPTWKWNEQFGLAYLEAMASGLPVVTTICGTNHEAVQPPNLLLPDDAEALAEGLSRFLLDAELRERVGARNRQHVLDHHELLTQAGRMGQAFASIERC